jgi:hypothetical protein
LLARTRALGLDPDMTRIGNRMGGAGDSGDSFLDHPDLFFVTVEPCRSPLIARSFSNGGATGRMPVFRCITPPSPRCSRRRRLQPRSGRRPDLHPGQCA